LGDEPERRPVRLELDRTPSVDRRGVEPRSPACKPGVFPLDQWPFLQPGSQGSARESNSVPLFTKEGCARHTHGPSSGSSITRVVPEGIEPPFPLCKRGVVAVGPRDVALTRHHSPSSSTGGIRTHRHQTLSLIAMPVRVPCHHEFVAHRSELRARESNHGVRVYETRPSAGPPAMESQAPVSSRDGRPYESRRGTCHA
jgi:hypothetical protein